jgi:DNA-binding transcriptional ArsR family regulator
MDALSATFAALADPTRRAILARLAQGEVHVGALAQPFTISAPAVSRHLRVLERAGLIRREVDAQWRLCHLQASALQSAHGWIDRYRLYWEHSLDRLAELVEQQEPGSTPPTRAPRHPDPAPKSPAPRPPRHRRNAR